MKFYLAPPKMRVAPQMPPQILRPGAATAKDPTIFSNSTKKCAGESRGLYQVLTSIDFERGLIISTIKFSRMCDCKSLRTS